MTDNDDLRVAAEAATPGPWRAVPHGAPESSIEVAAPDRTVTWLTATTTPHKPTFAAIEKDAAYIALASPDRILGILSELERKTVALKAMTDAWFAYQDDPYHEDVMVRLAKLDAFHETAKQARKVLGK